MEFIAGARRQPLSKAGAKDSGFLPDYKVVLSRLLGGAPKPDADSKDSTNPEHQDAITATAPASASAGKDAQLRTAASCMPLQGLGVDHQHARDQSCGDSHTIASKPEVQQQQQQYQQSHHRTASMPAVLYMNSQLSLDSQLTQLALLGWQSQHAQTMQAAPSVLEVKSKPPGIPGTAVGLTGAVDKHSAPTGSSAIADATQAATQHGAAAEFATAVDGLTNGAGHQHMGQSEGGASVTSWGTAAGVKQQYKSDAGSTSQPGTETEPCGCDLHGQTAAQLLSHADHAELHVGLRSHDVGYSSASSSVMPSRQVTLSSGGHSDHTSLPALSEGRVTTDSTAGDLVLVAHHVISAYSTLVPGVADHVTPTAPSATTTAAATHAQQQQAPGASMHMQQLPRVDSSTAPVPPTAAGSTATAGTDAGTTSTGVVQEGFLASVSSLNLSSVPGADIALAAGDFLMKCASGLVLQPSVSLAASNASFYSTSSGAENAQCHHRQQDHQQQYQQQPQQAATSVSAPLDWGLLNWASSALTVADAIRQPPLLLHQQQQHQHQGSSSTTTSGTCNNNSRPPCVPPLNLSSLPKEEGHNHGRGTKHHRPLPNLHPSQCHESDEDLARELAAWAPGPGRWLPPSEGRFHVFRPVTTKELRAQEALVASLPQPQAQQVSQLWNKLMEARYACELMACRGVRVAKDVTHEWSEMSGGLMDKIEGYELQLRESKAALSSKCDMVHHLQQQVAHLQAQLTAAQALLQAAANSGTTGNGSGGKRGSSSNGGAGGVLAEIHDSHAITHGTSHISIASSNRGSITKVGGPSSQGTTLGSGGGGAGTAHVLPSGAPVLPQRAARQAQGGAVRGVGKYLPGRCIGGGSAGSAGRTASNSNNPASAGGVGGVSALPTKRTSAGGAGAAGSARQQQAAQAAVAQAQAAAAQAQAAALESLSAECAELCTANAELKVELRDITGLFMQANDDAEALRADLHHHQAQQAAIWDAHQQLTATHAALSDSLADMQTQYAALQEEHEVLADQYNVLLQKYSQAVGSSTGDQQQQNQSETSLVAASVPSAPAPFGQSCSDSTAAAALGTHQQKPMAMMMSPRQLLQQGWGDACLVIRCSPSKAKVAPVRTSNTSSITTATTAPCAPVTPPAGVAAAFAGLEQQQQQGPIFQVLPPPAPTPPHPSAAPAFAPTPAKDIGVKAAYETGDGRNGEEPSAFGSFGAQAWFGGQTFSCPTSPSPYAYNGPSTALLQPIHPAVPANATCPASVLQPTGTAPAASCTAGVLQPTGSTRCTWGGTLPTSASTGAARVLVWGPSRVKPVQCGTSFPLKHSSSLDSSISANTLLGQGQGQLMLSTLESAGITAAAATLGLDASTSASALACAVAATSAGEGPGQPPALPQCQCASLKRRQSQQVQQHQGVVTPMSTSLGTRLSGAVLSIPGDVPSDEELARALAAAKQQGTATALL